MPGILIVAYGNPLRCDDGVAWRAADALEEKFPNSEVEILRLHQLAPEVADALRSRELVVFVDATCIDDLEDPHPAEIRIRKIANSERERHRPGQFSHVYSPERIVELALELYGATPKAIVATVAGEDFEHGDRLSNSVAAAIPSLISEIERLVREHTSSSDK